jgi:hypothetical protein
MEVLFGIFLLLPLVGLVLMGIVWGTMILLWLLALFLSLCLREVVKFSFRAAIWLARQLWHGGALAAEFLFLLIEEWRRGPDGQTEKTEQEEEFFRQEEKPQPRLAETYEQALALLGVARNCTQAALTP